MIRFSFFFFLVLPSFLLSGCSAPSDELLDKTFKTYLKSINKRKELLKKGISMCTEAQCLGALSKDNEIYISCDKFGDMPRRRAYENVGLQSFGKCLSRLRNANLKRKTEKKRKAERLSFPRASGWELFPVYERPSFSLVRKVDLYKDLKSFVLSSDEDIFLGASDRLFVRVETEKNEVYFLEPPPFVIPESEGILAVFVEFEDRAYCLGRRSLNKITRVIDSFTAYNADCGFRYEDLQGREFIRHKFRKYNFWILLS